jgi:hypothetical protein
MSAEQAAVAALLGMNVKYEDCPLQSESNDHDSPQNAASKQRKRKYDPLSIKPMGTSSATASLPKTLEDDTTAELEHDKRSKPSKRRKKNKVHFIAPTFPVQPRVVQVCKKPWTHVDHSYRDFSCVPPEKGYQHPRDIRSMTFSQKLHHILSRDDLSNVIAWASHGRAFRILIPKRLEQENILLEYFGHSRYSTFLSQLKKYGLKQITTGKDQNCYYHEVMVRALPHLCKYMPEFKDGRKLIADPHNEPDLYTISMMWPVPLREKPKKETHSMEAVMDGLLQQARQQPPAAAAAPSLSMTSNAVIQAAGAGQQQSSSFNAIA